MDIDLSRLPYKHRFAAASMLMSRANRLLDHAAENSDPKSGKALSKVLEAIAFYDIALSVMKRHDPNYQTLLNWKCQALISIGQLEDARMWYEELVVIARESEGHSHLGATAQLATEWLARLAGGTNSPLPTPSSLETKMFDDPPFCDWAEQFCYLLCNRKYRDAYRCLSAESASLTSQAKLKEDWEAMVGKNGKDLQVNLETYKVADATDDVDRLGWCYFSVSNDELNEAISMDIHRTSSNSYEVRRLEFGRP